MPTELSELLNDERWIEVEIGKVTFGVAYLPSSTSLLRQAEIEKKMRLLTSGADADEVEAAKEMAEIVCELLSDWDLVNKGEPVPLTPQVLAGTLPLVVFNAITAAISEDGRAQQEEKKALSATSGAGSQRKDKRASARNGTSPSAPQGTWA